MKHKYMRELDHAHSPMTGGLCSVWRCIECGKTFEGEDGQWKHPVDLTLCTKPVCRKLNEETKKIIRETVVLFHRDPPEVTSSWVIGLLENQWPGFWEDK